MASLAWIPIAVLILALVFGLGTPVKAHQWRCTAPADAACEAAFAADDPAAAGFCDLGRSQWAWTAPAASLTASYDLVCSNAWKAQVANSFFFVVSGTQRLLLPPGLRPRPVLGGAAGGGGCRAQGCPGSQAGWLPWRCAAPHTANVLMCRAT